MQGCSFIYGPWPAYLALRSADTRFLDLKGDFDDMPGNAFKFELRTRLRYPRGPLALTLWGSFS